MNEIRIIGGQFRGKKIPVISVEDLRPTPNRVRETLFNWLMHSIHDARCLDAFAGTGALGFEAFSRGAARVVLIEQNIAAYNNLKKISSTFNRTNLNALTVLRNNACDYLQTTKEQFDIIFLDPPFIQNYLPTCIHHIERSQILSNNGLLYLEAPHEITLDNTYWTLLKLKHAGQVVYALYQKRVSLKP